MANKIAVVFPGQGSQSVGMMTELYNDFPVVRETYQAASEVLGYDLWTMTKIGPAEMLNQTINTQPAMLVAGVACWQVLQEKHDFVPSYFAGHSLGEYSALVASGQLDFIEAVRLAKKRAAAMQVAVPTGTGAMAAIIGLAATVIDDVCAQVSNTNEQVWSANDNAPGQIVIAGHKVAVEKACEVLKQTGAKRALLLPVSVPSHCPLMQSAADQMQEAFISANWSAATAPVIHNCDVTSHDSKMAIVTALTAQLIKPVRWVETIQFFAHNGVKTVIEAGPGKVLVGLNKRIERNMIAKPVFDVVSLDDTLTLFN